MSLINGTSLALLTIKMATARRGYITNVRVSMPKISMTFTD